MQKSLKNSSLSVIVACLLSTATNATSNICQNVPFTGDQLQRLFKVMPVWTVGMQCSPSTGQNYWCMFEFNFLDQCCYIVVLICGSLTFNEMLDCVTNCKWTPYSIATYILYAHAHGAIENPYVPFHAYSQQLLMHYNYDNRNFCMTKACLLYTCTYNLYFLI